MIDLIDQKAYASFTVPSDKPFRYKPWMDQLLFVHAVDDIATRRSVEEARFIGAAIRRAAFLHRRRIHAAQHLHRVKALARKVQVYRALRDYERGLGVLDVDVTDLRVACGTERVRTELPRRSFTTRFIDPEWKSRRATERRETLLAGRLARLHIHLGHVDDVCQARQAARLARRAELLKTTFTVNKRLFVARRSFPTPSLLRRLNRPIHRPTRHQLEDRLDLAAARHESALRVVRANGHKEVARATELSAAVRRARSIEARRLLYLEPAARPAPSRRVVKRLTRRYWRGSIFARCVAATFARRDRLNERTAFARKQIHLVNAVQKQRRLALQKTYVLDATPMFKAQPAGYVPKTAIQIRLENARPRVRPALALRMYHSGQRRRNIIFARQWVARRHWAHVRVVAARYRAARSRIRHMGGVTWNIATPAPTRSRPALVARLKVRPERELAANHMIRMEIANITREIYQQQKVSRIRHRLHGVARRAAACRALHEAEHVWMVRRQTLDMEYVTSCRDNVIVNKRSAAHNETIKCILARRRKTVMTDHRLTHRARRATIKVRAADMRRARLARLERERHRAAEYHRMAVRGRRAEGAKDISAAKRAEVELQAPVLPRVHG